jgi:hypothetical protein
MPSGECQLELRDALARFLQAFRARFGEPERDQPLLRRPRRASEEQRGIRSGDRVAGVGQPSIRSVRGRSGLRQDAGALPP